MHSDVIKDVYVDMDDVLAETSRMFLSLLYRQFGRSVEYHQLTSFSLNESLGLPPTDLQEFVRLAHTRDELMAIDPVVGAQSVLDGWSERGIRISVVTGRPPECHEVSCEWLEANRMPYDRVLIVDKYGRRQSGGPRQISLEEVALMPFGFAIEDSLQVATYLANRTSIAVALRNCPWNCPMVDHPRIRRCNSWHEISQALDDRRAM